VDEKRQYLEGKCSNFAGPEGQVYRKLPRRVSKKKRESLAENKPTCLALLNLCFF
jgi:hypothetical protein